MLKLYHIKTQFKPLDVLISDKLLRVLSPTRRTHDTANTRSEIVIVCKLLPLGQHKVQLSVFNASL